MREKILQEDDCAPDAREYFIKGMKEKFGLDFYAFRKNGTRNEIDDLCIQYYYHEFTLEFNGDDPYYILYADR